MCGHVGMMGKKLDTVNEDMAEDGMFVCQLRGTDSVGYGIVPANEELAPFVQKRLGAPPVYIKWPAGGAKVFVGHVRSATIGNAHNRDLAHPFIFDNIVGAHNGTLRGNWREELQCGTNEVFGSDSQAVFFNFAYNGVEETVSRIHGAWCFVWWDDDQQTLNMLRNAERPLWIAEGKDGNLYWASESWMLQAMARTGERDRDKFVKQSDGKMFHKLPVDTWMRYKFDDAGKIEVLEAIPLAGAVPPPLPPKQEREQIDWNTYEGPFEYLNYVDGRWVALDGTELEVGSREKLVMPEKPNTDTSNVVPINSGRKASLWRTVAGVTYVCTPGGNEIEFRSLIDEMTDGTCMCCNTYIDTPQQIGYLAEDYSFMVCADCVKEWGAEVDWDDVEFEDIEQEAAGPANGGPSELGNPGVPISDDIAALMAGVPMPPACKDKFKYQIMRDDKPVHGTFRTKAQMDIFVRKNAGSSIVVIPTDELDRVCTYVAAPEPKIVLNDLDERIPPSLTAGSSSKREVPVLQLPPATSEWPKKRALPTMNDGPRTNH